MRPLEAGLAGVGGTRVAAIVLAYEPIWAIGTGLTADAQQVCGLIRSTVQRIKSKEAAAGVRIQYGGSVKPTNIFDLRGCRPTSDRAATAGNAM